MAKWLKLYDIYIFQST